MKKAVIQALLDNGYPQNGYIITEDEQIKVPTKTWEQMKLGELQTILEELQDRLENEIGSVEIIAEANKKTSEIGYTLEFGLSGEIDQITYTER
jgi:hypothetical protein